VLDQLRVIRSTHASWASVCAQSVVPAEERDVAAARGERLDRIAHRRAY